MTELNRELQSLSPSAFIEMFELNLARVGGQIFRFCSNTNPMHTDIVWQGQTYVRLPIEVDGFDRTSNGALPRPVMRVSNLQGAMAALARENKYFLGCKLTRRRTFARFLDAVNFPQGNHEADPTQYLPDEVWFVDRKATENKIQMDFELASALDMQGVMLPKRQIIQNCCAWTYRSAECSYTGGPVAKEDGTPTSDPAEDKCGQRLSDCKKRFPEGAIPYGGFPGCGLVK
ncbi:MAG: phage minor tail protein L [Citrobacter sp.]